MGYTSGAIMKWAGKHKFLGDVREQNVRKKRILRSDRWQKTMKQEKML